MHPVLIAGYVALFFAVGAAFLCVNLLVGWLVRPRLPNAEKLEVYECGEPTIGSSFVQFDLRFYVVALLFIIFDVEVALFFPWATVFGKAVQLADPALATVQADGASLTPAAAGLLRELGVADPAVPQMSGLRQFLPPNAVPEELSAPEAVSRAGTTLARMAAADMLAFFAVLLVGFSYVWFRGDLDWVRAVSS
ncbi:MAG: NADH-quinone oxidoreductase subunit A, partial [Planctomycetia bacterium]|nr:NADH-quinone oxidoreductase subunit A [Planctomycetia bacterium]